MKITSVNVRIAENNDSETRMRGIATVVIDDCFAIHDIRIIEGEKGLFTAMPSRKTSSGKYRDIAHPITSECRKIFDDAVLEAYKKELQ